VGGARGRDAAQEKGPPATGSGQSDPRRIELITSRCYLPVLAGLVTLDRAGTGRQRQATRRPRPGLRATGGRSPSAVKRD